MTDQNAEQNNAKLIGRNEPCPCGSGKKYKRCCGVDAAPKLTAPKPSAFAGGMGTGAETGGSPTPQMPAMPTGGMTPDMLNQMDPQMMMQISQALQRLPRGQMQRLQAMVQKAMAGKDVSRESAEFEKTLPVDLQQLLHGFTAQAAALSGAGAPEIGADAGDTSAEAPAMSPAMTEDEARALVAKAAAEGKISKEQAETLLQAQAQSGTSASEAPGAEPAAASTGSEETSKLGGFFKGFRKKKS